MDALAESIKSCHLKELDLKCNNISHHGMAGLNEGIKKSSSIQMLNLSMNLLGTFGAATLSKGLVFCCHLMFL